MTQDSRMYHHSGTAPSSHLVCLVLALLVLADAETQSKTTTTTTTTATTTTLSCPDDLSPPCMGNRPPDLATDCCPVGAWHTCQPSRGLFCDHELGLFCRDGRGIAVADGKGKCKGKTLLLVCAANILKIYVRLCLTAHFETSRL